MRSVLTPSVGRVAWYGHKAVVGSLQLDESAAGVVFHPPAAKLSGNALDHIERSVGFVVPLDSLALEDRAEGPVGRDVEFNAVEEAVGHLKPVALPIGTEPSRAHDLALFLYEGGLIEGPSAASDDEASSSFLGLRHLLGSGSGEAVARAIL